jgi:CubicO group peptidase (beta-lactamase class C family)
MKKYYLLLFFISFLGLFNSVIAQNTKITVLNNDCGLLPFADLDSLSFSSLVIGSKGSDDFQEMLSNYTRFEHYKINYKADFDFVFPRVLKSKILVIGLFDDLGMEKEFLKFIGQVEKQTQIVLVVFGEVEKTIPFLGMPYLLCTGSKSVKTQENVPQILFGAKSTQATLTASLNSSLAQGMGFPIQSLGRLQYNYDAEKLGFDTTILNKIDNITQEAIDTKATPGCQVLVVKSGNVVFQRSYGYFTYEKQQKVTNHSVYDVASITKVVATVPTIMHLTQSGKIDLDEKISSYLPDLDSTNKSALVLRKILTHQSGLRAEMPGWFETFGNQSRFEKYYRSEPSDSFSIKVSDDWYARTEIEDSLWYWSKKKSLRRKYRGRDYKYRYSDMGFYMLKTMSEHLLREEMNVFLDKNLYASLGLGKMTYLPLEKYAQHTIVPSGYDSYFRKSDLQGYVHDYAAGLIGGVSGHAGVFSNANDIAILMQMFLQDGFYGGKKYFEPSLIKTFTQKQFKGNRRGLGWDKPRLGERVAISKSASANTFGHTGFTGGCVWVDPDEELIYIFLSNRTYPNYKNRKLIQSKIRLRIQDLIYESLK